MPQNYIPIFIFAAVALAIPLVTLLIAKAVRPENPHQTKLMPYECGIDPGDRIRGRYTIRFYIVAILFVIFDVEVIFLFPWAVQFGLLGGGQLGEREASGALPLIALLVAPLQRGRPKGPCRLLAAIDEHAGRHPSDAEGFFRLAGLIRFGRRHANHLLMA